MSRRILIAIILSWIASQWLSATRLRYATDLLAQIGEKIGLDSMVVTDSCVRDTIIPFDFKNRKARIDVRNGAIEHIGYCIFPDSTRSFATGPVQDFLERYTLCADIPILKEETLNRQLAVDNMSFEGMTFHDLKDMGRDSADYAINCLDERVYSVTWHHDSITRSTVTFPINYYLMRGTSMVENELRLFEELSDSLILDGYSPDSLIIEKEHLTPTWKPNCFIFEGNKFYTDLLTSNRYYQSADTTSVSMFKALYDISYPVESFSNLLTGLDIPNDISVELKMIAYPMETRYLTIPLSRMVGYFLSRGCEIFTGLTKLDDQAATYVVISKNSAWGYCHSMRITLEINQFEEKKGTGKAKITPYIPLPKIRSLFMENDKE